MILFRPTRPARRSSLKQVWIVISVTCAVLLVLQHSGSSITSAIVQPFARPIYSVHARLSRIAPGITGWFHTKQTLIRTQADLENEIIQLREVQVAYSALQQEHKLLASVVGLSVPTETPRTWAPIISKPPFAAYDTLVIGKGTADGIVSSQRVIATESYIGVVKEVFAHTAIVELLSRPGTTYEAIVGTSTRITVVGNGSGSFVSRIPQGVAIAAGVPVVLPGTPRAVIGTVTSVTAAPEDTFKDVFIESVSSLRDLEFVAIEL